MLCIGYFPFSIRGDIMYRNTDYEKKAKQKPSDVYLQAKLLFAVMGAFLGFRSTRRSPDFILIGILFGAAVGLGAGFIFVAYMKSKASKFSKLERSEGYTDATVAAVYEMIEKKPNLAGKATAAVIHNHRGEFNKTIAVLSDINESCFDSQPFGAELYYSQLMLAYHMLGNHELANETYNRGSYFMHTYMHSPTSGGYVSMALAVREYFLQHADRALEFISASDNAFMSGDIKEEDKLPQSCCWTINCYWRALFLACKGLTEDALKIIDNTNGIYVTDYYRMALNKLRNDIKNKHETNGSENI